MNNYNKFFIPRNLSRCVSFFLSFTLFFQSLAPSIVYAQEVTATPTPTETVAPTAAATADPTPSEVPSATPTPSAANPPLAETPTSTPTPDLTPVIEVAPTATPSVEVTPTTSPTPTETITPSVSITITPNQNNNNQPSSTPTQVVTPTATPTINLEPALVSAPSSTPRLSTDKADYAPTDTVTVNGTGLQPQTAYSLYIVSTDYPGVSYTSQIETDSNGNFSYQKTLDGTYRPNYTVEVRDGGNNTVAATTFTDTDSSNKIDICHWDNGDGGKWKLQSVSKDSTDAQGHDHHDKDIIPPYHYNFTHRDHNYVGDYPGLNYDTEGQAIWNNGCSVPTKATLTVKKVVNNTNGGSLAAKDFKFSVNGATATSFDASGTNILSVNAGTYTITEPATDGYEASLDNCSNLVLAAGGQATCTITNKSQKGTLEITKKTVGGDGTFDLSVAGPSSSDESITTENGTGKISLPVIAGTYSVSETAPDGWALTGNTCSKLQIKPGGKATCTITNTRNTGKLIAKKVVDDETDLTKWSFSLDKATPIAANSEGEVDFGSVTTLGSHTITESGPDGYHLSEVTGTNCNLDGSTVYASVAKDGTTTCTFTNHRNRGTISGYKYYDKNADQNWDENEPALSDWTIKLFKNNDGETGDEVDSTVTGTEPLGKYEFTNVPTGDYIVCESPKDGWENSTPTCEKVTLSRDGQLVSVNFGNLGTLSITACKYEDGNGKTEGGDKTEVNYWSFTLNESTTQTTGDSNCTTFSHLTPGEYTVKEGSKDGWYSADSETSQTVTLVDSNQTLNFYNYRLGSIYGFKWNDENSNREFDCKNDNEFSREQNRCEEKLSGWTIFIDENQNGKLDLASEDEEGHSEKFTKTNSDGNYSFTNLEPGTYRICEVQQRGWETTFPVENNCRNVTVTSGSENESNFGNHYQKPELRIEKFNDATGNETPGSSVKYHIRLTLSGNFLDNPIVRDLLPKDFKYQAGSWKAKLGEDYIDVPEPTYHSPGTWKLPNLKAGDVVELTYVADVDNGTDPGLYKDIAWAKGDEPVGGSSILAIAEDTGNFVGTEVTINKNTQDTPSVKVINETKVEGSVLGASTDMLPATGANSNVLLLAIFGLLAGASLSGLTLILKKKYE